MASSPPMPSMAALKMLKPASPVTSSDDSSGSDESNEQDAQDPLEILSNAIDDLDGLIKSQPDWSGLKTPVAELQSLLQEYSKKGDGSNYTNPGMSMGGK